MMDILKAHPQSGQQFVLLAHMYARTDSRSLSDLRYALIKSRCGAAGTPGPADSLRGGSWTKTAVARLGCAAQVHTCPGHGRSVVRGKRRGRHGSSCAPSGCGRGHECAVRAGLGRCHARNAGNESSPTSDFGGGVVADRRRLLLLRVSGLPRWHHSRTTVGREMRLLCGHPAPAPRLTVTLADIMSHCADDGSIYSRSSGRRLCSLPFVWSNLSQQSCWPPWWIACSARM